jgi:acetyl-CoA carboxylase carboxyl transferase subunit beta
MNWIKDFIPTMKKKSDRDIRWRKDSKIPEGLWKSCDKCGSILYIPELQKNSYVCSKCGPPFQDQCKRTY